jgi:nucleoside-triphosphatase THEP1
MLTFKAIKVDGGPEAAKAVEAYPEAALEQQVADTITALGSYYGDPSRMGPLSAEARRDLGLDIYQKTMDQDERVQVLLGLNAQGEPLGDQTDTRSVHGYDLTWSAPKTWSAAWAAADDQPDVRLKLELAFRQTIDEVMQIVASELGWSRTGAQGKGKPHKAEIIWQSFSHFTARPTAALPDDSPGPRHQNVPNIIRNVRPDFQRHDHIHLYNIARSLEDGKWRTLDTSIIQGRVHIWGALFQAALARNTRAIGVGMEEAHGFSRVTQVPQSVEDICSKRTDEAERLAKNWAKDNNQDFDELTREEQISLVKHMAHKSRMDKEDHGDAREFMASWRAELAAVGFDKVEISPDADARIDKEDALAIGVNVVRRELLQMLSGSAFITIQQAELCATRGMIARSEIKRKDVAEMFRRATTEPIKIDGIETNIVVIKDDKSGKMWVSTALQYEREKFIQTAAAELRGQRKHAIPADIVNGFIARQKSEPNAKQIEAIHALTAGGDFAMAVGAAGVGKTTLLRPVADSYRNQGYRIVSLAIAWRTANALGADLKDFEEAVPGANKIKKKGDAVAAVDKLIAAVEKGQMSFDDKTVLVIDEMSMLDVARTAKILEIRERFGCKLIAVGDHRQAMPVGAGFGMRLLADEGHDVELDQTLRQKDKWYREEVDKLRIGNTDDATIAPILEAKLARSDLQLCDDGRIETIKKVVDKLEQYKALSNDVGISTPTNSDALAISREIRRRMKKSGEISTDEFKVQATDLKGIVKNDLKISVGDTMRLYAVTFADVGGRRTQIGENGTYIKVKEIDKRGMRVTNGNGVEGFIDWKALRNQKGVVQLGYSYASSIENAQGRTADYWIDAMISGTGLVNGNRFYVAESRARYATATVVDRKAEIEEWRKSLAIGENPPQPDNKGLLALMAERLGKFTEKPNIADLLAKEGHRLIQGASAIEAGVAAMLREDDERHIDRKLENWLRYDDRLIQSRPATVAKAARVVGAAVEETWTVMEKVRGAVKSFTGALEKLRATIAENKDRLIEALRGGFGDGHDRSRPSNSIDFTD